MVCPAILRVHEKGPLNMARSSAVTVPPSLQALYARHIRQLNPHNSPLDTLVISNNVFARTPPYRRLSLLELAQASAEWLADYHDGGVSAGARREFINARKAEILAGTFPVEFWQPITKTGPWSLTYQPTWQLAPGSVDPAYADPLRIATKPNYRVNSTRVTLPPPMTGPPGASPGFYGDVQTGVYADRWQSSLQYFAQLPVTMPKRTTQKLWLKVDWSLDLSASFRGNRMWMVPACNFRIDTVPRWPTAEGSGFPGWIQQHRVYRLPLTPEATPWIVTSSGRYLNELGYAYHGEWNPLFDALAVMVAPIPPHGRYFSRNDWIQCWLTATVDIYLSQTRLAA